MFTIEKNIPIPPKKRCTVKSKYPFAEMKIGDSFFNAKRKLSHTFIARKIAENTYRVWRVK